MRFAAERHVSGEEMFAFEEAQNSIGRLAAAKVCHHDRNCAVAAAKLQILFELCKKVGFCSVARP